MSTYYEVPHCASSSILPSQPYITAEKWSMPSGFQARFDHPKELEEKRRLESQ
jgi:hypothetical protein